MEPSIQKIIGLIMSIKLYQYTKTILKYGKHGMNQIILKIIIMLENGQQNPQNPKIYLIGLEQFLNILDYLELLMKLQKKLIQHVGWQLVV